MKQKYSDRKLGKTYDMSLETSCLLGIEKYNIIWYEEGIWKGDCAQFNSFYELNIALARFKLISSKCLQSNQEPML